MNDTRKYGIPVLKQMGDIERLLRATSAMRNALDEFETAYINKGVISDTPLNAPAHIYEELERGVMRLIAMTIDDYYN